MIPQRGGPSEFEDEDEDEEDAEYEIDEAGMATRVEDGGRVEGETNWETEKEDEEDWERKGFEIKFELMRDEEEYSDW